MLKCSLFPDSFLSLLLKKNSSVWDTLPNKKQTSVIIYNNNNKSAEIIPFRRTTFEELCLLRRFCTMHQLVRREIYIKHCISRRGTFLHCGDPNLRVAFKKHGNRTLWYNCYFIYKRERCWKSARKAEIAGRRTLKWRTVISCNQL